MMNNCLKPATLGLLIGALILSSISGCGDVRIDPNRSILVVDVVGVTWEKEDKRNWGRVVGQEFNTVIEYKSQSEKKDTVKLIFKGIHDFKKDHSYKIVVNKSDGALISWQPHIVNGVAVTSTMPPSSPPTVKLPPKQDSTVYKIVVDRNGKVLSTTEVEK